MSSSRFEYRRVRRLFGALAMGVVLACGPTPASASGAHSSPRDRQRFVSVTHSLEQAPLKSGGKADREWAMAWLTEAPDIGVTICPNMLGGLVQSDYHYAGELVLQDMLSMGAFAVEHPEAANDSNAQQTAGVEGALTAYRSILRDKPDAKSPDLEALLQTQAQGGLTDFVRRALIDCSAKR